MKMIIKIEYKLLAKLQRRCTHPDYMVASDILEGDVSNLQVKYCNRCGAVKPQWHDQKQVFRCPDPNLWR